MQDPRLRILVSLLLSAGAFLSVAGAVGTIIWWAIVALPARKFVRPAAAAFVFGVIGLAAAFTLLFGGDGVSYAIRMSALALVAFWVYASWKPGEYLATLVWLFPGTFGFRLGIITEIALQDLTVIGEDFARIRMALAVKGTPLSIRTIVPVIAFLLTSQIRRAEEQADLLAIRGYRGSGRYCPSFTSGWRDAACVILAVLAFLVAFSPVRAFFILPC